MGCPLWKHAYVDSFSELNHAIDGISPQSMPPTAALAVSDEDLGNTVLLRKLHQGTHGVAPVQDVDGGPQVAGDAEIQIDSGLVVRREIRLMDVSDYQVSMKTVRVAPAALENGPGIGSRSDSHQDTLLQSPLFLDVVGPQIIPEL